jgi:hypothetical protein
VIKDWQLWVLAIALWILFLVIVMRGHGNP